MLTLLLADAELERVPASITGHPQVATAARRAGASASRMLLDASLHHAAMRKLDDAGRRGRPDIVHQFLLVALESRLNLAGHAQVLVHTRENLLIRVDPSTRLVRNFNRFCGLVQQLLETRKVPPEKPLLTVEPDWSLHDVVASLHADRVLVLDPQGEPREPWEIFGAGDGARHVAAVIGGFPSGTFRSRLPEGERVSLGPHAYAVWTVAAEVLAHYGRAVAATGADAPEARPPRPPRRSPPAPGPAD